MLVKSPESKLRVVAFFHNAAEGNLAIQILTSLGTPNDRLGVTPPDQIEGGQGMILSIGCQDEKSLAKAEDVCRKLGGQLHRQRLRRSRLSRDQTTLPETLPAIVGLVSMHHRPVSEQSLVACRPVSSPALLCNPARVQGPRTFRPLPSTCPAVHSGPPVLVFNGKDLTGFYTYLHDHKYDRPRQGLHRPRRAAAHLGPGVRRSDHAPGVCRLSPHYRMEVGRNDMAPEGAEMPVIPGSCSTASGPTGPRWDTGWNHWSARSSKAAAATSHGSRPCQAQPDL